MAFLSPKSTTCRIVGETGVVGDVNVLCVAGALWLHNGHWQKASWPAQVSTVGDLTQVSADEYWAIGSVGENIDNTLLHFANGVWTAYL